MQVELQHLLKPDIVEVLNSKELEVILQYWEQQTQQQLPACSDFELRELSGRLQLITNIRAQGSKLAKTLEEKDLPSETKTPAMAGARRP